MSAMAKLNHVDEELMKKRCRLASSCDKVKEFDSKHISNTMNAMAKLNHVDEELMKKLRIAARDKTIDLKP